MHRFFSPRFKKNTVFFRLAPYALRACIFFTALLCFGTPRAYAYTDPNARTCQLNYKMCKDNEQLAQEWDEMLSIRNACEIAASHEIKAKTGSLPHWQPAIKGGAFPSYLMGDSGPREGKLVLMDYHVQAADAYGTTAERHASCEVDLEKRTISDVSYK